MRTRLVVLIAMLGLSGCNWFNANKSSSSTNVADNSPNQLETEFATAKKELVTALKKMIDEGDPNQRLCSKSYCGESAVVCSDLRVVNREASRREYLQATYFTKDKISAVLGRLVSANIIFTEDVNQTTQDGEVKDAVVTGNDITILKSRVATGMPASQILLLAVNAIYLAGESSVGRAGPYSIREDAVTAAGSCLTSFSRASAGKQPQGRANPVFDDNFNVTSSTVGLSDEWLQPANAFFRYRELNGISGFVFRNGAFEDIPWAEVKSVSLRDVRVTSYVVSDFPTAALFIRARDNRSKGYQFSVSNRTYSLTRLSDQKVLASYTVVDQPRYGIEHELVLEARGNRFHGFFDGQLMFSVIDDSFPEAGAVGFKYGNLDRFLVEEVKP